MNEHCELRVSVVNGVVRAELDLPGMTGKVYQEAPASYEDLHRDTVELLERWVRRWVELAKSAQHAVVDDTFKVLGRHLFEVIFRDVPNGPRQALRDGLKEAQQQGFRLRIRLFLTEDDMHLDRLPWEFLYYDGGANESSFFLAKRADLQLYRSLALTEIASLRPCTAPLEVLFVAPMEDDGTVADVRYWPNVASLRSTLKAVANDCRDGDRQLLVYDVADTWSLEELETKLAEHPHVVHVVGHARITDDETEILLPGPDDEPVWMGGDDFVEMLVRKQQPSDKPRMVVLHLRERHDAQFTDTFERLAPKLIRSGIPIVVAMQYPLEDQRADRFMRSLYPSIAKGTEVHVAVQRARDRLATQRDLLMVGTPVLYLQGNDTRLVDLSSQVAPTRFDGPSKFAAGAASPPQQPALVEFRSKLERILADHGGEQGDEELSTWFDSIDWALPPPELVKLVRRRIRQDRSRTDRDVAYTRILTTIEEHQPRREAVG